MKINQFFKRDKVEFDFPTSQPRQIERRQAIGFRWPTTKKEADDYVKEWRGIAEREFGRLCVSRATVREIASHVSRRSGELRMTDAMLAGRSGRSIGSTKRDIRRAKDLGLILVSHEPGRKGTERVRVIRLSVPLGVEVVVSTPPDENDEGGRLNGVGRVETHDSTGDTRNVAA